MAMETLACGVPFDWCQHWSSRFARWVSAMLYRWVRGLGRVNPVVLNAYGGDPLGLGVS